MATKNQIKNTATEKTRFFLVSVLKHGILYQDGRMLYTDTRDRWLYVSEDGETVLMYTSLAELINDLYRKSDNDDFVVTGWDMDVYRFTAYIGDAEHYYDARYGD